jgi:hypothetical protein
MTAATVRRILPALIGATLLLAGCGGAPAANTPDGAVRQAFREIDEGDLDGLMALTCAGQQDTITEQFGFGELGRSTGLDLAPLFEALNVDVSKLGIATTSLDGDRASVRLAGTLGFSFDATRLRELFRELTEQQGIPVDDAALDRMLEALAGTTQALPVNELVDVVREDGAWKLCSRLTLLR